MKPDISVILPFYNSQDTLRSAVDSVLQQTFSNLELILVDNESDDDSYSIAAEYAVSDPRVKVIEEPDRNIVKALNRGIEEANGRYIARMDADDLCMPERFEKQFNFLEENADIGLVSCQVQHMSHGEDQTGLEEYVNWNNKLLTPEEISLSRFIESPVIHPTVIFRRELIDQFGSYEDGFFPEDYELWLRWMEKGVRFAKLNEVLLVWSDLPTRMTRTDDRYSEQAFYEIKSRYLYNWLEKNNRFHPKAVIWGAGRISRRRFAILHELGVEAKFFIDINANPTRNVIQYRQTPMPGNHFILSYVTNRGAREQIRVFLTELGYVEGKDFLCLS